MRSGLPPSRWPCLAASFRWAQRPKSPGSSCRLSPGRAGGLRGARAGRAARQGTGHTVIVENKPGANGAIGAQEVARATPDGSTLWITSVGAAAINPRCTTSCPTTCRRTSRRCRWSSTTSSCWWSIRPTPPRRSRLRREQQRSARSRPPMASSGIGSIPHLAIEQLADGQPGEPDARPVQGRGTGHHRPDGRTGGWLLRRHPGPDRARQGRQAQGARLASSGATRRCPDVRTLEEQGIAKGVDTNNWYALFAPARTRRRRWSTRSTEAVRNAPWPRPALRDRLLASGAEPRPRRRASWRLLKARHRQVGPPDQGQGHQARVTRPKEQLMPARPPGGARHEARAGRDRAATSWPNAARCRCCTRCCSTARPIASAGSAADGRAQPDRGAGRDLRELIDPAGGGAQPRGASSSMRMFRTP
jgi:tripartite-type tricarboxylate transporter receptor subunit TctC